MFVRAKSFLVDSIETFKCRIINQTWQLTSISPAFERLRQEEHHEFEDSMSYTESSRPSWHYKEALFHKMHKLNQIKTNNKPKSIGSCNLQMGMIWLPPLLFVFLFLVLLLWLRLQALQWIRVLFLIWEEMLSVFPYLISCWLSICG